MTHSPYLEYKARERAELKARAAHPIMYRVALLVVFLRDLVQWIRNWRYLRVLGYAGKPRKR